MSPTRTVVLLAGVALTVTVATGCNPTGAPRIDPTTTPPTAVDGGGLPPISDRAARRPTGLISLSLQEG